MFKGNQRPYQKECVLIIDRSTGTITLERLSSNIQVKKTRFRETFIIIFQSRSISTAYFSCLGKSRLTNPPPYPRRRPDPTPPWTPLVIVLKDRLRGLESLLEAVEAHREHPVSCECPRPDIERLLHKSPRKYQNFCNL